MSDINFLPERNVSDIVTEIIYCDVFRCILIDQIGVQFAVCFKNQVLYFIFIEFDKYRFTSHITSSKLNSNNFYEINDMDRKVYNRTYLHEKRYVRENFCGNIKQIQFKLDLRHQIHTLNGIDDEKGCPLIEFFVFYYLYFSKKIFSLK